MTGTSSITAFNYSSYTSYHTASKKTVETDVSINERNNTVEKQESQRGTVMAEYYTRKPQYRELQEGRISMGYSVLSSIGLSAEEMESMSMSEFRNVISNTIADIPHHGTRPYDEETVLITEEGWENMKKDPDYAAWVVGIIKEDRSVSNPFFGMGDKGAFITQTFGGSPSDYHGYGYSKIYGGTAAGARSMYNSAKSGGIETRAPQADMQPPADYDLWEERRKARSRKKKQLDDEILANYFQKKRINEKNINEYYENKALERSRSVAEMIGSRNNSLHIPKLSMASGTAFYEASFMTSDIADMF